MKYWLGMVLSKLRDISMKLPKPPAAWRNPDRGQLKFAAILSCVLVAVIFSGVILTTFAIEWGFVVTEARLNPVDPALVIVEVDIPSWNNAEIRRIIYPGRVIAFDPIAEHTGHVPQYLFIEVAFPTHNYSLVFSRNQFSIGGRDAVADFNASGNGGLGTLAPSGAWSGTLPNNPPYGHLFQAPAPNANWVVIDRRPNVFLNAQGEEVAENAAGAQRHDIWVFGYTGGVNGVTQPGHETSTLFTTLPVANFLERMHRLPEYQLDMGTEFNIRVTAFATQANYIPNTLTGVNIPNRPNDTGASTNMNSWNAATRLLNAYRIYLARSGNADVVTAFANAGIDGF